MAILEDNPAPSNPLGVNGIEFIEYATSQPQALGALLQNLGFHAVARHRSREVVLYRQGPMNLIVNAHPDDRAGALSLPTRPELTAIALRVRDAGAAWQHARDLGAWEIPTHASAMELNIPGIRGVDDSFIYFVDRYEQLTIYDVDFVPLPDSDLHPPAIAGLHYFGVVQTIFADRTPEWIAFYQDLLGFTVLPGGTYFVVLPKGTLLESPCHTFYLQLIEPPPGRDFEGLAGHLHAYKIDIAKAMLELCHALGAPLLLVCSSTSTHAMGEPQAALADLRKLATLGVPLGVRVAFEALSWGRHINEYFQAWRIVERANHPNLGLGLDSYHILASGSSLDRLEDVYPEKIFLVQLADYMWQAIPSAQERMETARHFRVFPGEGVHSKETADLVLRLDAMGYYGAYSFEVFNDDYVQLPVSVVAKRARESARWLAGHVPRRSLPRRVAFARHTGSA